VRKRAEASAKTSGPLLDGTRGPAAALTGGKAGRRIARDVAGDGSMVARGTLQGD
jgi:hypothetical protein